MGKSSSADRAASQAAAAQTAFAREIYGEVRPVRANLIGDAMDFLSGDRDVSGLPEFAAAKSAGEYQYANARDNIIANTPEGGALTAALTNLEGSRARGMTELSGALSSDEINRALQLATFGTAQGSAGMAAAAATQAARAQAEAAQNAAKSEGVGRAAGSFLGAK